MSLFLQVSRWLKVLGGSRSVRTSWCDRKRQNNVVEPVGRCAEQPRGERKAVPVPFCFTAKHLSFMAIPKAGCVSVLLLSFPLWGKAR